MARLKDIYKQDVVPALMDKFQYKNVMQVPKVTKVVVSMGVGAAIQDAKIMDGAVSDITKITGQKPLVIKSRKSISNFKLREGMKVGTKVTLRGAMMYEFLDRFFNIALPRVRDFQGIDTESFDGRGNFSTGLKEQLVFPEIAYDKIDRIRGMNIAICTSANTDEEGRELLKALGLPFKR
ncbi:MAG: 50S ribosomal protein L5 [Abditibacteriota bacterium]|nr:50S ribosomal protein L5 [Abditibacteriota bacterium]